MNKADVEMEFTIVFADWSENKISDDTFMARARRYKERWIQAPG